MLNNFLLASLGTFFIFFVTRAAFILLDSPVASLLYVVGGVFILTAFLEKIEGR